MSMGLCPTRASRAREPRYEFVGASSKIHQFELQSSVAKNGKDGHMDKNLKKLGRLF